MSATVAKTHEADAFVCDPRIVAGLTRAVEHSALSPGSCRRERATTRWSWGALCPAGMLFVRCKGGVSHNPLELITLEDCAFGLAALTRFVREFRIA